MIALSRSKKPSTQSTPRSPVGNLVALKKTDVFPRLFLWVIEQAWDESKKKWVYKGPIFEGRAEQHVLFLKYRDDVLEVEFE